MSKGKSLNTKLIVGVIALVLIVATVFLTAHSSFSGKLQSVTISVNSGPVSPEFQETTTLELTESKCEITTVKTVSNDTTTEPCNLQSGKFTDISKGIVTYGVVDKIVANNSKPISQENQIGGPIGGKTYFISIKLNNGTTYTTQSNASFTASIQPMLDNLGLYVDNFSDLGI